MKLAFLHIPKTGGISVEKSIEAAMPDANVCPVYRPDEYEGKTYGDLAGYDLYRGHFKWDFLTGLPADYVKAVVVRRPFDQVLSLANHIACRDEHPMYAAAQERGLTAILDDTQANHNLLSKYLLGMPRYREICHDASKTKADRIEMAVNEVRDNLKSFDVIGVTTRLNKFIAALSDRCGVKIAPPKHLNKNAVVTFQKDDLSEEQNALVRKATWLDMPVFKMISTEFL